MSSGLMRSRAAIVAVVSSFCLALAPAFAVAQQHVSAFTIPNAQLIQPDELNRILHERNVQRPLILQVGSRMMFAQAHIPGSEYAGPGSQPDGLQQLRTRVASLPRSSSIVLYCGCCPWNRCPNVGPAYNTLHDMGFTRVKVLYLADNFGADWAAKGYPVETGQ